MSLTKEQGERAQEACLKLIASLYEAVPAEMLTGPQGAEAVAGFVIGNIGGLGVIVEDVSTLATMIHTNHRARFDELERTIVKLMDRVEALEARLDAPQN